MVIIQGLISGKLFVCTMSKDAVSKVRDDHDLRMSKTEAGLWIAEPSALNHIKSHCENTHYQLGEVKLN